MATARTRSAADTQRARFLELLRNVEDALSDEGRPGSALIRLEDGDLIVANEGGQFTDRRFRALRTLNDSAKPTDRIELLSGRIAARFDRSAAGPLIRQRIGEAGVATLEEDGPWPNHRMPLLQVP
jgi:hypothetical protein